MSEECFDLDNDICDGIKIEKLKDTDNILTASRATTYRESGGKICCVGFKRGGIVSAVFNLCGDALGPSILSIPYVYYTSGVGLGTLINLFGLVFAIVSTNMMLRTRLVTMSRSFEDASKYLFGNVGLYMLNISFVIILYGACIAYIINVGALMSPIISVLEKQVKWMNREFVTSALWLFIIVPLSLYDKTSELTFTSFLSLVGCIIFSLVTMIYACANNISEHVKHLKSFEFNQGIFESLSIILFSYVFQTNIYPIHSDLTVPTESTMKVVNFYCALICLVLYTVGGVFGYIASPINTPGNILDTLVITSDRNVQPLYLSIFLSIAYISMGFTTIFCYPLNVIPLRYTFRTIVFGENNNDNEAYKKKIKIFEVVVTLVLCVSSLLIALFYSKIEVVFSLCGGLPSAIIGFILPAGGIVKLYWKGYENISKILFYEAVVVLLLGIIFGIYSIVSSILIFC